MGLADVESYFEFCYDFKSTEKNVMKSRESIRKDVIVVARSMNYRNGDIMGK